VTEDIEELTEDDLTSMLDAPAIDEDIGELREDDLTSMLDVPAIDEDAELEASLVEEIAVGGTYDLS
jgi:hypothetical protein